MLEGEDKPLLPAAFEPLSPTSAYITVTEGRYHQVRRMFAAVGNHVVALHRDRIGGLDAARRSGGGGVCGDGRSGGGGSGAGALMTNSAFS